MPSEPWEIIHEIVPTPTSHKKNDVSRKSLTSLEKVMFKQDDYGFDKYQKPLSHKMNYNWMTMEKEEIADFLKYLQCEEDRKADVIHMLKMGLRSDVPKDYIELALELLTIEGTGK
ncbi:hypothetical protein J1P26_19980 [Neobacillus sp. MM2021_6]|uniref:hypothetical protein n=1 Tax=Bacillaceae TaxID=186817 RepID=UPI001408AF6B|nr:MULTISPECIES: hypothetical protein [Bacillaceae]MBO0961988.1 hypothetical protein [Neobacillus sp. MM2021_6]NHC20316.1 hypothetical protein [Bacillus sp. MM2020_4]